MEFGDINGSGIEALDRHLADKSYIEGYLPTQADVVVFKALTSAPAGSHLNALRWFLHITSFGAESAAFPAAGVAVKFGAAAAKAAPAPADDDDDDDLDDMFASDDEEDQEAERIKAERVAAYAAKKAKKPALIAKSNILLDVKPWDDETDLKEAEAEIRKISTDGLVWGASKLVPIAFGIKKIQICCVVEDDKVGTDWLEEKITELEDYVQSVDIAAFNKI